MIKVFEQADFYSCEDDGENLWHESVEEALDEWLSSNAELGESELATLKRVAPIEVFGFKRKAICPSDLIRYARDLRERLDELISDDYGGQHELLVGDYVGAEGESKLEELLIKLSKKWDVYRCDLHASKEFTAEEILALLPDLSDEAP